MKSELPVRACSVCKDEVELFPFSMAFQPIVDTRDESIYAYEALVRGPNSESAYSVLSQVTEVNRYAFDQACRVKAITLASKLGLVETGARLSINFMPNAIYSPAACLRVTLTAAAECNFPTNRLIFEVTEQEKVLDPNHLRNIISEYLRQGFEVAIDDFGAGFASLALLSDFKPSILKLDMELTRNLDSRPQASKIVSHIVGLAASLKCAVIAEGIETEAEYHAVRDCGIHLMQGYFFARPIFEKLPTPTFPATFHNASADQPKQPPSETILV